MWWFFIGIAFISFGYWGPFCKFSWCMGIPHVEYWDLAALGLTIAYNIYFCFTQSDDNGWHRSCVQSMRRLVTGFFILNMIFLGVAFLALLYIKNHLLAVFCVMLYTGGSLLIDSIVKCQSKKSYQEDKDNPNHLKHQINFEKLVKYIDTPSLIAFVLVISYVYWKKIYDPLPLQASHIIGLLSGAIAFQMITSNIIFASIFRGSKKGLGQ